MNSPTPVPPELCPSYGWPTPAPAVAVAVAAHEPAGDWRGKLAWEFLHFYRPGRDSAACGRGPKSRHSGSRPRCPRCLDILDRRAAK